MEGTGDIIGKTDYELMDFESANKCRITDMEALKKNAPTVAIEAIDDKIYETRKFPVAISKNETGIGAYITDITEHFNQQLKISETNRIIAECMLKPFIDKQDQLDYALYEAIKLTNSQYGYISLYNEKEKEFTLNRWTNGVIKDCSITEIQTKYQFDILGIWGEVIRQRRPLIVNDFDLPIYPKGNLTIHKFMSIPLFENEQIVAIIGFANKKTDYTQYDVQLLTILVAGVWSIIKKREKEKETEILLERTQSMINNHEAVMLLIEPFSGKIIEANNAAVYFYGYSKEELLNMAIQDINMLNKDEVSNLRLKALNKGQKYFTFPHRLKNGEIRIVDVYSSPIEYNGKKVLFSIIFDVTKREEVTKQNEYLAYYDYLTGIYNRRFFEEEFVRQNIESNYPIAILIGNINGFKIFNDSFGHLEGDRALKEVSNRIKECLNSKDIFARISGDEFAIMVTQTNEENIKMYMDKIDEYVNDGSEDEDKYYLSISFGYGIQRKAADSLDDLLKEAEAFMYNRKYYNSRSIRSKTVNVIMNTLFEKSEREKNHSERVGIICNAIATKMQWDTQLVNRIRVAGFLHDIGKIGIGEEILNKSGKLDKTEWEIMKLHPVKGARILENTIEFKDITDIILSHHERYDGTGYPKGLKEEEIPIEARIIAVADAYDAMTNERTYRKAMSEEDAVRELTICSGTQFDPEIISVFTKVLPVNHFSGK